MLHHYYHNGELVAGGRLRLEGTEGHHLVRAIRISVGEEVVIVNGLGVKALASVVATKRSSADLEILSLEKGKEAAVPLYLVQALPRPPRLDFILEKATELGATKIILFPGERSERRLLSEHQWQRCHNITISAMKQCGRLYLPELVWWPEMDRWHTYDGKGYFGDLTATAPRLLDAWTPTLQGVPIAFCIGPEAGLSDHEESLLTARGWQGVKLHENILRTDTAPLVALAIMSHLLLHH